MESRSSGLLSDLWRCFLICVSLSSGFGLTAPLMGRNSRKSEWVSLCVCVCRDGVEGGFEGDKAPAVPLKPMSDFGSLSHTHSYLLHWVWYIYFCLHIYMILYQPPSLPSLPLTPPVPRSRPWAAGNTGSCSAALIRGSLGRQGCNYECVFHI